MNNPVSDACCTRMGWVEATIYIGMHDLHVSYPRDTDTDDTFQAFCHDEQEMIKINGWLIEEIEIIETDQI